ncbi:MAG: sugar ABC transporter substrate-binding protein [Treponema sp.]|jgi:multiple sugar transport system substrate-binding protein|nr:sugar ABC transporter substrate-binding protein [Treponema sp.]
MIRKNIMLCGVLLALATAVFANASKDTGGAADSKATGTFDWKRFSGATITVYMVEHATTTAIQAKIKDFEAQTGVKVNIQVTPEANYFDQVSNALSSRSGTPDIFMSGVYQIWNYSTAGNVEPLDDYLSNPALAAPGYDYGDLVPSVVNALKWDGVAGHAVGSGNLLALPLCCEIYSLAYNKRAFEKAGIAKVPETYDELLEACDKLKEWNGPGSYAIALRGARDWGTIHPAYMSTFANFGAKDFAIEGGRLVSKVNSPESAAMNQFWVELVKRGGSPQWSNTFWYIGQAELGAGKAAMQWDADNNSIQVNLQNMAEGGNIAFAPMPVAKAGNPVKSNFWIWSMAMNANSKAKGASWLFLQYFTSKEFLEAASVQSNNMDPVRTSTWNSAGFKAKMASQEGYIDVFNKTSPNASILFTPQPAFFETTLDWAETLQNMVAGRVTVQAGLDALKQRMDRAVQQ